MQFAIGQFGGCVPFLDMEIYRNAAGLWHTRLFYKTTDVHAYLSPESAHQQHVMENIPKGVALRIRRACSEKKSFFQFQSVFFLNRGYSCRVVRAAFNLVLPGTCSIPEIW